MPELFSSLLRLGAIQISRPFLPFNVAQLQTRDVFMRQPLSQFQSVKR